MDAFNLLACGSPHFDNPLVLVLFVVFFGGAAVLQFLMDNMVVIGSAVLGTTLLASLLVMLTKQPASFETEPLDVSGFRS